MEKRGSKLKYTFNVTPRSSLSTPGVRIVVVTEISSIMPHILTLTNTKETTAPCGVYFGSIEISSMSNGS